MWEFDQFVFGRILILKRVCVFFLNFFFFSWSQHDEEKIQKLVAQASYYYYWFLTSVVFNSMWYFVNSVGSFGDTVPEWGWWWKSTVSSWWAKILYTKIVHSTPKCENRLGELTPLMTGRVANCKDCHVTLSHKTNCRDYYMTLFHETSLKLQLSVSLRDRSSHWGSVWVKQLFSSECSFRPYIIK